MDDGLVDFLKRIIPITHEPLATQVASEWADRFRAEVLPGIRKSHFDEAAQVAYEDCHRWWLTESAPDNDTDQALDCMRAVRDAGRA